MTDFANKMIRIANRAVQKAQEENRRKGIPNVYELDGKTVWQLPDGRIVDKSPF